MNEEVMNNTEAEVVEQPEVSAEQQGSDKRGISIVTASAATANVLSIKTSVQKKTTVSSKRPCPSTEYPRPSRAAEPCVLRHW